MTAGMFVEDLTEKRSPVRRGTAAPCGRLQQASVAASTRRLIDNGDLAKHSLFDQQMFSVYANKSAIIAALAVISPAATAHADEPPAPLSVAELSVLADGATKTRSLNFQMGDAVPQLGYRMRTRTSACVSDWSPIAITENVAAFPSCVERGFCGNDDLCRFCWPPGQ